MTTLGLIDDVGRTLYVDEVEHASVYPLDHKIQLLEINGQRSRYTINFARLAAGFYARMPERDALDMLDKALNIKLEKDPLACIGAAIAQPHLPGLYSGAEAKDALKPVISGPGFVEGRIREIDASPDREDIILKALEGEVAGSDSKTAGRELAAIYIEADGTGVHGLPKELSDKGKNGGPAKTFEAKIGVLFKQGFDSSGLPLLNNGCIYREPGSTQYMGTVEKVGQFAPQLAAFARGNGIDCADQAVFLSDGAPWLEKLRGKLYPGSIGIIDLYHARQHLNKLVDTLRFHGKDRKTVFYEECSRILDLGDIDGLASLITNRATNSNRASVEKQLEYFTGNKDKMRYGLFRAAGLFIGSGVVESACKTIVENRLNGSGMRWSKKNAANVIALRCAIYSGLYDNAAA